MGVTSRRSLAAAGAVLLAMAWAGRGAWAQPPADVYAQVRAADNGFGFALLGQLSQGQKDNVFFSPLSVALALDMTANGAGGDTRQAMMKTLGVQGLSLADVNRGSLHLLAGLTNADPRVEFSIANSLWLQTGMTFVPKFVSDASEFYGAKATSVDFTKPDAGPTIDAWVKEATRGWIPEIAGSEPFVKDTVCVLADAVYFQGQWTTAFDETKTKTGPFTKLDGSTVDLPMMSQTATFDYLERPNFQAVRLPYGVGRLAMYIVLPGEKSSIADLGKALTADSWKEWTSAMGPARGAIVLPRFRVDYGVDLSPALKAMGMEAAFDPAKADFSNMCSVRGQVFIKNVLHVTLLDVNEVGTIAAAATQVQVEGRGAGGPQPFAMVVDRPFLCAIADRDTGTILFLGSIVSPEPGIAPPVATAPAQPETGAGTGQAQPHGRRGFVRPGLPGRPVPRGGQAPPGADLPPPTTVQQY
jgi:serine protease inhibitor